MSNIVKSNIDPKEIAGIECRFVVYVPPSVDSRGRYTKDDYHLIKECIHLKDNTSVSNVRLIKNFEINYYKTREAFAAKHKSKKEWEKIERLQKFKTTRGRYLEDAARIFQDHNILKNLPIKGDSPWFKAESYLKRQLARSPHLYGSDIESTALIKHEYDIRFKGEKTLYSVACFDVETDMVDGHGKIIMATLSFKDKVITAVTKDFLKSIPDFKPKLFETFEKELGQIAKERGINWELVVVANDLQVIQACFNKAHEWKPDIVAIWNIDFDMTKVLETLSNYGVNPKDVFSDPSVPKEHRYFEYKRGQSRKVTDSGKETPIPPPQRWHTVFCPSSFYLIDAMCAYRHLRGGQGEERSYSLNDIMNKHIKRGKLNFNEVRESEGPDWHVIMQSKYKLQYIIYNVFDCIGMELLDEETTDLSVSLPLQAGPSDWRNFNSQPRRGFDELHFYLLERGHVAATTSDQMVDEFDHLTIGLSGWITMLAPHPVIENGLQIIEEFPNVHTTIRVSNGDLDVKASYPNGECVFNISKETTHRELIDIENVSELDRRMQGINLSGGATNAVEICTSLFGMPTLNQTLNQFLVDEAIKNSSF